MRNLIKPTLIGFFSLAFALVCFSLAQAEEETLTEQENTEPEQLYYILDLHYNQQTEELNLNLNEGGSSLPISVDPYNYTRDSGTGSQFYAKVFNLNGQAETFPDGANKFYLGQWEFKIMWDGMDEEGNFIGGERDLEEGSLKVSIPYFPEGQRLEIYRTKNDEAVLSINVEAFSEKGQEELKTAIEEALAEQPTADTGEASGEFRSSRDNESTSVQNQQQSSSVLLIFGIIALIVIVIGAAVVIMIRRKS